MKIENEITETVRSFSGIKSSLPQGALQTMDAEDIRNFVTLRGRLRKIWGAGLYYNSGFGSGRIRWIENFSDLWMAQHGSAIIRELTEGLANFGIAGYILDGEQNTVRSEKWENRIYLTNSVENRYLEEPGNVEYNPGDSFLNLGIVPPGNGAKNWTGDGAFQPNIVTSKVSAPGSTLADATYGYVVTWWDANRKVESLPWGSQVGEDGLWRSFALAFADSIAAAFSGMTNNAVRVDISALKAFGYDTQRITHFIVYRQTQADGATFKRVADPSDPLQEALLRISNDYYDDQTVEANLGAVLDESISPPPSGLYYNGTGNKNTDKGSIGPRFVKFYRDQLWLFGTQLPGTPNGTELQPDGVSAKQTNYAAQNGIAYASAVENHEYWQYTYNIGRSSGQRDTGMAKHRNTLIFFKEGSAYYLDGSSPDNYVIRELDTKRGITVPGSLAETTIGVIGLGAEGFTLFDSVAGGQIVSDELNNLVERINLDAADQITAFFDPKEEKYECHVPLDNFTYNSHVFSFDCKLKCWEITRRVGAAGAYAIGSNKRIKGLIGDPRNGRLYDVSDYSRVTLNGQTLHGLWRSKGFDFGRPGELKSVQMVEITARAVTDFRISIDLITDFGQGDTASVEDVAPDVRGDKWAEDQDDDGGMKWDGGQWSKGVEKKKFTILIQGVGKNFNLVIRNSDRDADRASFEIEEVIVRASLIDGDNDG